MSSATVNSEVKIFPSVDQLANELAQLLQAAATAAIKERGVFHVALSGGSLPATLGKALSGASKNLDLSSWHWWFADERCVKKDDKESNYAEARKHVFEPLGIKQEKVHAIDENKIEQPTEAASAYESTLRSLIPSGSLDVLLLGMGPDGHCCSLFPGHALLKEQEKWIAPITDSPKPPPERITMTFPLIERARASYFVTTGSSKADALREVVSQRAAASGEVTADMLPSARVRSQQVVFLVDKDAAAKLPAAQQQQNKL